MKNFESPSILASPHLAHEAPHLAWAKGGCEMLYRVLEARQNNVARPNQTKLRSLTRLASRISLAPALHAIGSCLATLSRRSEELRAAWGTRQEGDG